MLGIRMWYTVCEKYQGVICKKKTHSNIYNADLFLKYSMHGWVCKRPLASL